MFESHPQWREKNINKTNTDDGRDWAFWMLIWDFAKQKRNQSQQHQRHNGSSTTKLSASSLETENLPANGIHHKSKHRPLAAMNRMNVLWACVEYLIVCSVIPCRLLRLAAGASLPGQALGSLTAAQSQAWQDKESENYSKSKSQAVQKLSPLPRFDKSSLAAGACLGIQGWSCCGPSILPPMATSVCRGRRSLSTWRTPPIPSPGSFLPLSYGMHDDLQGGWTLSKAHLAFGCRVYLCRCPVGCLWAWPQQQGNNRDDVIVHSLQTHPHLLCVLLLNVI